MLKTGLVFGDNMVIQTAKPFVIWGTATPGALIDISIQDKSSTCIANEQGEWKAVLSPLEVSAHEQLLIRSGQETLRYDNVAVGEVWLAGGQSNMEFYMRYEENYEEALKTVENPDIRFFDYPEVCYEGQYEDYDYSRFGYWRRCDAENLEYYSAVSYYFAKELQGCLNVPVGIIGCNWGGTSACAWMSEKSVKTAGFEWWSDYEQQLNNLDIDQYKAAYKHNIVNDRTNPFEGFNEVAMRVVPREQQLAIMENFGGIPTITCGPMDSWRPSGLYEYMLKKLAPYAIRGFLYYQGENDDPKAHLYECMMTALIQDWRELWHEELPFLLVQLPPFEAWLASTAEHYPVLRRAQDTVSKTIPNVWLASIGDVGMRFDIHPKNKRPVGQRLAYLAENHVYGKHEITSDAPEPVGFQCDGTGILITFRNVSQFELRGDTVKALSIYSGSKELSPDKYHVEVGNDYWKITGDLLLSEQLHLNFAETNYYELNLFNEAGIPLKPFAMDLT